MPDANSQAGRRKLFSRIGGDTDSKKSSRRRHLKASIQVIVKPDLYESSLLLQHKSASTEGVGLDDVEEETLSPQDGDCARDILRRNSVLTASLSARRRRDGPSDGRVTSAGAASDREFAITGRRRYRTADAEHFRQYDPARLKNSSPSNVTDAKIQESTCESGHSEMVCRDALQTAARARRSLALKRDPKLAMNAHELTIGQAPVQAEETEDMKLLLKKNAPPPITEPIVPQRHPCPPSHGKAKISSELSNSKPDSMRRKIVFKENPASRGVKNIHRGPCDPPDRIPRPRGDKPCDPSDRISRPRGNKPCERYDDEEYVEDLAQLDVLLHYVNNLSASLEFLDWEKNKRISTDLVPTLLDIYDALYAKLADGPEGEVSCPAGNVSKTVAGGVDSSSRQGNESRNSDDLNTAARINSLEVPSEKVLDESSVSVLGNNRINAKFKSSNHCPNKNELSHEGATLTGSEDNIGVDGHSYDNRGESEKSFMGSSVSANHSAERRLPGTSPRSARVSEPSSAVTIISETQDSVEETLSTSLSVPRQMVHPSVAHIPPRSPVHPRRASSPSEQDGPIPTDVTSLAVNPKHNSNDLKSTTVVRPLSSVSSSSSSSSNSLRRGHAGVNTSYLASVESLVEADEEAEASLASGRRRERSLKVRRDFRGHFSRPGSCDSGVAQCHGLAALAAAPAATTAPTTAASHHHQYPHHLLQRHHLHHPAYDEGKPLSHMDLLVMEVLDTEASYVHGLMEVIQGYLEPWLRGEDSGVSPLQATELFSNLTEIHDFNRLLLRELQWCGVDPVMLARIFVRNNAGFSIYTQYCTHYPRTVSLLTELMSNTESASCFRQRQQALGHTLPLGSYLLKPVQRILKYHLLLENILKNFDRESNVDGYNVILNARNAMTGMAHHINDMKRKHEHCVRVQEIQSLLYGWQGADLTTFGELAAEGTFRIVSAKGIRHVFLFSKMLLICKKKVENILMYKTHIMCSNLMLIESIPREPLCFQVIPFDNPRLQYTLQARNREHKHEWTQQLKRLILENYSAEIPPHARQLVMELGRAKQDEVLPLSGSSGGRRQVACSGPEYLQKRRRGRRASEVPSTPTSGGARLRLRRLSKDSVESGRSRSASRGRDTEDDDDTQRSLLPLSDKPKLRLSMWRRRSEPNVPKDSHSLGSSCTPPTPSVYSTAPTTPTHHLPDDASAAEGAAVADLTQHSRDLLDTPEVLVVRSLPEQYSATRLSFSGRCFVALQPAHSAELSAHPTVYVQVDSLSISECERDSGLSQSKPGDDDDGESTQENLEEIVSQLLQHNLHLQKLLLSKHRRGLLTRKRSRGLSGQVSNTASETSDTENDDVISHDSGLPITSINSMNSINHVLPSPETCNSPAAGIRINNNSPPQASLTSPDGEKCHQNYVDFYLDRNQKQCREARNYFSNKTDTVAHENGSSSEGTSVYSSAISISQRDSGKSIIPESVDAHHPKPSDSKTRPVSGFGKSVSNYDNLGNVWGVRIGETPDRGLMEGSSANSNCSVNNESVDKNLTGDGEDKTVLIRRAQSFASRTCADKGDFDVRTCDVSPETCSAHSPGCKDRRVTIAVYENSSEGIVDHQSDKCSVSTSSTLNASSFNESTVCDEQFTDCSESVQLEDSFNVHPEHKIYTSAILSRHSLKNVMNKLVSARKSSSQDEAVVTVGSSLDTATTDKTPGKLVYSMARQCTKTLKERIKQIRSEEESCTLTTSKSSALNKPSITGPVKNVGCENSKRALQEINSMSQYKQGSSSIGEKLATNCITSLKNDSGSVSDNTHFENSQPVFPQFETSAKACTNTSPSDTLNDLDDLNLDDSSGSLEEFEDDNSGGDSYYERSFEVIEDMMENDLFRDSAIYSDPEDPDSKISVSDLTKNLPRSILNRVSKSPSVRSDKSNYSGKNSLPRKSPSVKSSTNKYEYTQDQAVNAIACQEGNDCAANSIILDDLIDVPEGSNAGGYTRESDESDACLEVDQSSSSSANNERSSTIAPCSSDSNISKKCPRSSTVLNVAEKESSISNSILLDQDHSESSGCKNSRTVNNERSVGAVHGNFTDSSNITKNEEKFSLQNDVSLPLSSPNLAIESPMSCTGSPRKKTPPPVPAKPGVCSRASRHCGSKILSQLKSLEECTKFSRATNCSVVELDGLKSLDERRKELKSSTEGNRNAEETIIEKNNQLSDQGRLDSTENQTNSQESNEIEKKKVPSSPLMSVRSFVTRNVASVTTSLRSSRASTRQTTSLTSASDTNKLPPATNTAKLSCEVSEKESCLSAELGKGIIHTRTPIENISITRRKSIKTIGNYISKFNSRSSSVPPKLHVRFESRQSSLPSENVDGDESDSGTELLSNTDKSGDEEASTKRIASSVSFPESFRSSDLTSLPCQSVQFLDDTGGPRSLPSPNVDSDDSNSSSGGVIIEKRRPKGWVRHVVGRLQQSENSYQTPKVTHVESGS
ncbi:Dbl (DH) domain [Trinorchestia longiramus]|nr:Dbl (DH) domain [Trinorchestia longiramus]